MSKIANESNALQIMSFILSNILKKKIPLWNIHIHDENDFYLIAEETNASVIEADIKSKGEYVIFKDRPFIIFRKGLKQSLRLWVGMHELGHHLLHYPVNHRFSKSVVRRMDREANFFAAIALIPTRLVESKTLGEITEEYNYPKDLIVIRKEIYEAYKI